jgi:hypothetical protein
VVVEAPVAGTNRSTSRAKVHAGSNQGGLTLWKAVSYVVFSVTVFGYFSCGSVVFAMCFNVSVFQSNVDRVSARAWGKFSVGRFINHFPPQRTHGTAALGADVINVGVGAIE